MVPEKAMAPHSSTLAWKIPWMEEPGRLQSMGLQRIEHDWATSLSLFTFLHWTRKWQPTPVFLPGESWGRRSLVGCRLWGRTESDTTEVTAAAAAALVVQRLRLCTPNAGGPSSIPGQESRSYMLQQRVRMLQLKILSAARKTEDPVCHK